jgi:shikimate kinase
MDWMNRNGLTVYLELDPETLVSRLRNSALNRPLLENKTEEEMLEFISTRLEERKKFYESAALTINARDLKLKDFYQTVKAAMS